MYTLIRMRALATRTILVQTRRPEEKAFEYGLKGNLSDFHRSTLNERKQFGYPPFSCLIKITLEGKKGEIAQSMAAIQKLIEPREMDIFPAFTSTVRGNSVIHGLVKIEPAQWPDVELAAKLRSLPLSASVKIDPESLL
jgi:primosomal protein N'